MPLVPGVRKKFSGIAFLLPNVNRTGRRAENDRNEVECPCRMADEYAVCHASNSIYYLLISLFMSARRRAAYPELSIRNGSEERDDFLLQAGGADLAH